MKKMFMEKKKWVKGILFILILFTFIAIYFKKVLYEVNPWTKVDDPIAYANSIKLEQNYTSKYGYSINFPADWVQTTWSPNLKNPNYICNKTLECIFIGNKNAYSGGDSEKGSIFILVSRNDDIKSIDDFKKLYPSSEHYIFLNSRDTDIRGKRAKVYEIKVFNRPQTEYLVLNNGLLYQIIFDSSDMSYKSYFINKDIFYQILSTFKFTESNSANAD